MDVTQQGVEVNEATDTGPKAKAERAPPGDDSNYLRETSLSHITRRTTKARFLASRDFATECVGFQRH